MIIQNTSSEISNDNDVEMGSADGGNDSISADLSGSASASAADHSSSSLETAPKLRASTEDSSGRRDHQALLSSKKEKKKRRSEAAERPRKPRELVLKIGEDDMLECSIDGLVKWSTGHAVKWTALIGSCALLASANAFFSALATSTQLHVFSRSGRRVREKQK